MSKNQVHWDTLGHNYNRVWQSSAKRALSCKEMDFINNNLRITASKKILDIGVGNGRIIENYLLNKKVQKVYGIDIAQKMIEVCQNKFKGSRVKLAICDISKEKLPFDHKYDFISAIRILKYNKEWRSIIKKLKNHLSNGGIFVFTMPNINSLNIFSRYIIPVYKTTPSELKKICHELNLEIIEMKTFTRIPDLLYDLSENTVYIHLLLGLENIFSIILGDYLLGRMIFISVKNNKLNINRTVDGDQI